MTSLTLPNGLVVQHTNSLETAGLFREIFERRIYAGCGIELPPRSVVVDAGANIGLFTLFVLDNCPTAHVHAFEPAPEIFQLLRANTQACATVEINNYGLGAYRTEEPFTYFPRAPLFSGYDGEAARRRVLAALGPQWNQYTKGRKGAEAFCKAQLITTRVEPLSHYIDERKLPRIDLLKIDVEGRECAVLQGIRAEHWALVRQLAVEVHEEDSLAESRRILDEHGYAVQVVPQQQPISMLYARRC